MSDSVIKTHVEDIITTSGFEKSNKLLCPILKILHMRHKELNTFQAHRVTLQVLVEA